MDTILQGIPGVTCYIDDILISANDEQSHLQSLEYVFHAWKSMVFDSNKKMWIPTTSVEYLQMQLHDFSASIHPFAIKDAIGQELTIIK